MPRRSAGISGVAVTFASIGGWLVYAGIRDIDPISGLATLLRGDIPESRTPGGLQLSTSIGSQRHVGNVVPKGTPSGPVPQGATKLACPPIPVVAPSEPTCIRVHDSIASNVTLLLREAYQDGVRFGGWGWRSNLAQRALRLRHGYTSDDQPSGSGGRTPVARPGQSMHERGLAIDFTINGRTIRRGDAGFNWLAANAVRFGLRNLPSESWHWSTNGS
jgi:hypothetical protein